MVLHMLMKFTKSYNNNTVELGEGNETKRNGPNCKKSVECGEGGERPTCILNSVGARAGSHAPRNRPVLQPFLPCLSVQHQHGGTLHITSPNDQH
jgi:hypothetical protein